MNIDQMQKKLVRNNKEGRGNTTIRIIDNNCYMKIIGIRCGTKVAVLASLDILTAPDLHMPVCQEALRLHV